MITAAKFYCETEDVVVNVDIARLLGLGSTIQEGLEMLNKMESSLIDLIDFNMFVSTVDYNKNQNIINERIKKQKETDNLQRI